MSQPTQFECPYSRCTTKGSIGGVKNHLRVKHGDVTDVVMLDRGSRISTRKLLETFGLTMRKIKHCPLCASINPDTVDGVTDCCEATPCPGLEKTFAYGGERTPACCKGVASVLLDGSASEVN